mgnify:CR=1 FL=1
MYRVAFIGCGGIARAHAGGYARVPECRMIAAADVSPEALAAFGEQFGIEQRFADYDQMLADVRPDIVSICTWPPLHPAPAIAAARAGVKGIVCEKPMALNLALADQMNAAAKASGTVLIVGHQRRFAPRYAQARRLIADGAIGEVEEILNICGGDLLSDGTHAVDLMRFLAGDRPVEWVFGQIDLRPPNVGNTERVGYQQWNQTGTRYGHPIEGGSMAQLQFAGGPRGLLETGFAARPLGYQRVRVLGSDGRIEISGDPSRDRPSFLRVWTRGSAEWRDIDLPPGHDFEAEIRALLDSIEHGTPHLLSGESGRANLEVLLAIMESALRHERVTLPLAVQDHPLMRDQPGETRS